MQSSFYKSDFLFVYNIPPNYKRNTIKGIKFINYCKFVPRPDGEFRCAFALLQIGQHQLEANERVLLARHSIESTVINDYRLQVDEVWFRSCVEQQEAPPFKPMIRSNFIFAYNIPGNFEPMPFLSEICRSSRILVLSGPDKQSKCAIIEIPNDRQSEIDSIIQILQQTQIPIRNSKQEVFVDVDEIWLHHTEIDVKEATEILNKKEQSKRNARSSDSSSASNLPEESTNSILTSSSMDTDARYPRTKQQNFGDSTFNSYSDNVEFSSGFIAFTEKHDNQMKAAASFQTSSDKFSDRSPNTSNFSRFDTGRRDKSANTRSSITAAASNTYSAPYHEETYSGDKFPQQLSNKPLHTRSDISKSRTDNRPDISDSSGFSSSYNTRPAFTAGPTDTPPFPTNNSNVRPNFSGKPPNTNRPGEAPSGTPRFQTNNYNVRPNFPVKPSNHPGEAYNKTGFSTPDNNTYSGFPGAPNSQGNFSAPGAGPSLRPNIPAVRPMLGLQPAGDFSNSTSGGFVPSSNVPDQPSNRMEYSDVHGSHADTKIESHSTGPSLLPSKRSFDSAFPHTADVKQDMFEQSTKSEELTIDEDDSDMSNLSRSTLLFLPNVPPRVTAKQIKDLIPQLEECVIDYCNSRRVGFVLLPGFSSFESEQAVNAFYDNFKIEAEKIWLQPINMMDSAADKKASPPAKDDFADKLDISCDPINFMRTTGISDVTQYLYYCVNVDGIPGNLVDKFLSFLPAYVGKTHYRCLMTERGDMRCLILAGTKQDAEHLRNNLITTVGKDPHFAGINILSMACNMPNSLAPIPNGQEIRSRRLLFTNLPNWPVSIIIRYLASFMPEAIALYCPASDKKISLGYAYVGYKDHKACFYDYTRLSNWHLGGNTDWRINISFVTDAGWTDSGPIPETKVLQLDNFRIASQHKQIATNEETNFLSVPSVISRYSNLSPLPNDFPRLLRRTSKIMIHNYVKFFKNVSPFPIKAFRRYLEEHEMVKEMYVMKNDRLLYDVVLTIVDSSKEISNEKSCENKCQTIHTIHRIMYNRSTYTIDLARSICEPVDQLSTLFLPVSENHFGEHCPSHFVLFYNFPIGNLWTQERYLNSVYDICKNAKSFCVIPNDVNSDPYGFFNGCVVARFTDPRDCRSYMTEVQSPIVLPSSDDIWLTFVVMYSTLSKTACGQVYNIPQHNTFNWMRFDKSVNKWVSDSGPLDLFVCTCHSKELPANI